LNEKLKLLANSLSSSLGFLLTYTYNYIFIADSHGNWIGSECIFTGPFWTLAIEEQFYLVFPFIVYFLNKRTLKILVISLILLVPLFRLLWGIGGKIYFNYEYENYLIGEQIYKFTFLQADSLATGAALALFDFKWIKNSLQWFLISLLFLLLIGLFNLLILKSSGSKLDWACIGFEYPGHWLVNTCNWKIVNLRYVYNYSIINLTAALFVLSVIQGKSNFGILHNNFTLYLGQISYGLYIYHQGLLAIFSETILPKLLYLKTLVPLFSEAIFFTLYFALLFTISHLSYIFIERTFLKLKIHH
jgi:peptidoglycan/LPS O-acetylase OafA/YrhL